ncbi:DMT family transporter [Lacrimispora aerotolerans]|uniref:DMT family transporter n=1 Tax=Lacrimispora aerotolerans TaxID=36832 RepID=UPI00047D508F|nr:DMT family transporter [Lacrimispora aerotolerans]
MNIQDGKGIKALSALGLIVTTIIWGSAFVVMKNSVDIISPTYLLALRFTIASMALVAVFFNRLKLVNKTEILCGSLLGVFLFVSYLLQTYGVKYTTASKNAFITTLYVIIVPFLHWFFNKKRPSVNNIGAAVIAVFGLALISLEGDLSINIGDLLTLFCGLFFAFHIVFVDRYTDHHDPVRLTVIQMVAAAILSWILAPIMEGTQDFTVINGSMLIGLLYLGIFSTMICFLLQNVGQKHLSPNTTSIILSFEAVFGLVFSVIFLGEEVTPKLMAGCILLFASVILSEYQRKKKA